MPPVRTYVAAKIHGVRVTDASVGYHGSVTIGGDLMHAAGIDPYEQVHVANLGTGARWVAYATPGPDRAFTLNGGDARLGVPGDRCVVTTYCQAQSFDGANILYCTDANAFTLDVYEDPCLCYEPAQRTDGAAGR